MEHVVYSQVYLNDMAHYDAMERVWREFFPEGAAGARRARRLQAADRHRGRDQRRRVPRPARARGRIVPAGYPPNLSWSPGVMAGNRLYLSGFLGADVATGRVPHDPDAQVQLALDNMKQTLAAAGMDFRHVVFVNPYLTDKASRQMNAIYAKHFEFGNTPARATIRVTSLPGGNTIAVHRRGRRRSVEAARGQAEEHEPERDGQPVRLCRRHVLLFGQGAVHARAARRPAGHLGGHRRSAGAADDAEPARRAGGSRVGARPTWWRPTCTWTTSTTFRG